MQANANAISRPSASRGISKGGKPVRSAVRRRLSAFVAALVGGFLLYLAANPQSSPSTGFWSLVSGLVLFLVTTSLLQRYYEPGRDNLAADEIFVPEWKMARFLSRARDAAPLFLGIRLFLGAEWLEAGLHKLEDPRWFQTGEALRGYWERAVTIPALPGKPSITYPLYRSVMQFMLDNGWEAWFKYLIIFGEILVGIGLILGALTAIAVAFGMLMNFAFLYAGSTSSNPTFILLGGLIILGWRVSGWWGVDRWLLPYLGTPWGRPTNVRTSIGANG